jgi:hypothetical protein
VPHTQGRGGGEGGGGGRLAYLQVVQVLKKCIGQRRLNAPCHTKIAASCEMRRCGIGDAGLGASVHDQGMDGLQVSKGSVADRGLVTTLHVKHPDAERVDEDTHTHLHAAE